MGIAKRGQTADRGQAELTAKIIELLEQYQSKERRARDKAFDAIRLLGDKRMPPLLSLLRGNEVSLARPELRALAGQMVYAFVKPNDLEALTAVISVLGDTDPRVRSIASQTLPRITEEPSAIPDSAVNNVAAALAAEPLNSRYGSATSLAFLAAIVTSRAAPAIPALIETLSAKDWEIRTAAIASLGHIGTQSRRALPNLIRLVREDKHKEVRRGAAIALTRIAADLEDVLPAIREALRDSDPVVRQGIAEALGSLGGRAVAVVADLQLLLDDAKPSVRKAAASAIKRIGA